MGSRPAVNEAGVARSWKLLAWRGAPARQLSGKPLPQRRSRALNFAYRTAAWLGGSVLFVGLGFAAFFIYDASTYKGHAGPD